MNLILALALLLILEGLLPFVSPSAWRKTFLKLLQLSDGQLRFVGLSAVIAGVILLMIVK